MRMTLDGPDGWARGWTTNGHRVPLRVWQGGGGVLVWAAVMKDEPDGLFQVEDGLKSTPTPTASFWKILSPSNGTGRSLQHSRRPWSLCRTMFHHMHSSTGLPAKASKIILKWPGPLHHLSLIPWGICGPLSNVRFTVRKDNTPLWTAFGRLWLLLQQKVIVNRSRNWQTPWMEGSWQLLKKGVAILVTEWFWKAKYEI